MIKINHGRLFCFLLSVFVITQVQAIDNDDVSSNNRSGGYVGFGARLGLNRLDIETNDRIDIVGQSQGAQLSIGQEIFPILSVELSANLWLSNNKDDEDSSEHELIHDFHFSGLSLGINALFHFAQNIGPYAKVGAHCWGGGGYSEFELWSGVGCSKLVGGGFAANDKFYEISYIRFGEVDSWLFTIGYRK